MTDRETALEKVKIIANNAIYFDDNSDYHTALCDILMELGIEENELSELKFIDHEDL